MATPIYFGAPDRRLFGIYHSGDVTTRAPRAVLLCNPLGQEAIRVHRFYRVLAGRLARMGVSVLRFDPYGTGDSMGDDTDLSLAGWQADLLCAHAELTRRAPSSSVQWAGARLGATLALLALPRASRSLTGVVLWDVVIDGAAYRHDLRHRHADALATSYGLIGPDWHGMLNDESAFRGEAIGFALSAGFQEELQRTDVRLTVPASGIEVRVLGDPGDAALDSWINHCRAAGAAIDFTAHSHDFDWTAEEAVNTALVPPKVLQYFVSAIDA